MTKLVPINPALYNVPESKALEVWSQWTTRFGKSTFVELKLFSISKKKLNKTEKKNAMKVKQKKKQSVKPTKKRSLTGFEFKSPKYGEKFLEAQGLINKILGLK